MKNDRLGMVQQIAHSPLWFIDGVAGMDCARLCAAVRRLVRRQGIKLVVIDYLQKIKANETNEKRTYEIASVSGALKALAVSCNVAMLTLAQLNREAENRDKAGPRLADLAHSGQIECDADTVILLHRERSEAEGDACLILAKQRDGELGTVPLKFTGRFSRFETP